MSLQATVAVPAYADVVSGQTSQIVAFLLKLYTWVRPPAARDSGHPGSEELSSYHFDLRARLL